LTEWGKYHSQSRGQLTSHVSKPKYARDIGSKFNKHAARLLKHLAGGALQYTASVIVYRSLTNVHAPFFPALDKRRAERGAVDLEVDKETAPQDFEGGHE
jgi:hypothetical protein